MLRIRQEFEGSYLGIWRLICQDRILKVRISPVFTSIGDLSGSYRSSASVDGPIPFAVLLPRQFFVLMYTHTVSEWRGSRPLSRQSAPISTVQKLGNTFWLPSKNVWLDKIESNVAVHWKCSSKEHFFLLCVIYSVTHKRSTGAHTIEDIHFTQTTEPNYSYWTTHLFEWNLTTAWVQMQLESQRLLPLDFFWVKVKEYKTWWAKNDFSQEWAARILEQREFPFLGISSRADSFVHSQKIQLPVHCLTDRDSRKGC